MERYREPPGLPPRPAAGHKGTFGTVLVVAGSAGMAGAAGLCARAVLRSGAGLARAACPAGVQPQVAVMAPGATTLALPEEGGVVAPAAVPVLLAAARMATALAVGPGLGLGEGPRRVVHDLLAQAEPPVVLDADGLNLLAGEALAGAAGFRAPVILTPHPGEAGRLLGVTAAVVQADREGTAARLAAWCGGVCLLKGKETVVAQGGRLYVNPTGNSGLATGGSGDVLTGIVAALLAQGLSPFDAACLGAWLHGRAGDLAAAELTPWCLTAEDLLVWLPRSFAERAGKA